METYAMEFEGIYPVGAVAIISAPNLEEARSIAIDFFDVNGFSNTNIKDGKIDDDVVTFTKIITDRPSVKLILNGDY